MLISKSYRMPEDVLERINILKKTGTNNTKSDAEIIAEAVKMLDFLVNRNDGSMNLEKFVEETLIMWSYKG